MRRRSPPIGNILIPLMYSLFRMAISDSSRSLGQMFMTILITTWGLRLFYHISRRKLGKPENFRYVVFRRDWDDWLIPRAFLQIYLLQGVFLYLISLSIILTSHEGSTTNPAVLITGVLLWLIGFQPPKVNFIAAFLFYLLFIVGLMVFVINPALQSEDWRRALSLGMFFALIFEKGMLWDSLKVPCSFRL